MQAEPIPTAIAKVDGILHPLVAVRDQAAPKQTDPGNPDQARGEVRALSGRWLDSGLPGYPALRAQQELREAAPWD